MKASAIIVAAGSGTRLGFDIPKAFVQLNGRSMLWYSLRTIAAVPEIEEAIVTVPSGMESRARAEVKDAGLEIPVKLTPGGAERQDSVRIALELTSTEAELVIVHDAARPFATPAMFTAALMAAQRVGGAIVATPLADTLKRVSESMATPSTDTLGRVGESRTIVATVARANLWQAQTPQAFRRDLIIRAHEHALMDQVVATDDADLVERLGATVVVVAGSPLNFKITTADDLRLAELITATNSNR
jgi:2-C-methyl-D-erythritol 4-phosphate cytidylyltransferase